MRWVASYHFYAFLIKVTLRLLTLRLRRDKPKNVIVVMQFGKYLTFTDGKENNMSDNGSLINESPRQSQEKNLFNTVTCL